MSRKDGTIHALRRAGCAGRQTRQGPGPGAWCVRRGPELPSHSMRVQRLATRSPASSSSHISTPRLAAIALIVGNDPARCSSQVSAASFGSSPGGPSSRSWAEASLRNPAIQDKHASPGSVNCTSRPFRRSSVEPDGSDDSDGPGDWVSTNAPLPMSRCGRQWALAQRAAANRGRPGLCEAANYRDYETTAGCRRGVGGKSRHRSDSRRP